MHKLSIDSHDNAIDYIVEEIQDTSEENTPEHNPQMEEFYQGLYALYDDDLAEAKKIFSNILEHADRFNPAYYTYLSFVGLLEVILLKSNGGLQRCYDAIQGSSNDAELYFNLAYAEHILENRRRCVVAIEKCLQYNPKHAYAPRFQTCIGIRKKDDKKRNTRTKKTLGKLFRKKKDKQNRETCALIFKDNLSNKLDLYMEEVIKRT